jgi:hypothetical protein
MTTKTITRERLAELRARARSDGLSPATSAELLDACGALLEERERMAGPVCTDTDCPDYDGEHPHHQNVLAVEFERGQKVGRETWWRAGFEACRELATKVAEEHFVAGTANAIRALKTGGPDVNYREKAEQEVGCTCSDTMCVAKRARFERALREAAAEAFMDGWRFAVDGAEVIDEDEQPVNADMRFETPLDEAQRIREGRD